MTRALFLALALLAGCGEDIATTTQALGGCDTTDAGPPPDAPVRSMVAYGDSIIWGQGASVPSLAVVPLMRLTYPGTITLDAAQGRALTEDPTALARISAINATEYWLEIGANDYRHGNFVPSVFAAAYAALVDGIHVAHPRARIYCQTMLWLVSRGANRLGFTAQQYRDSIRSTCSYTARSWATLVEGIRTLYTPAVLDETGLDQVDGTHPNDRGHAKYAAWIRSQVVW